MCFFSSRSPNMLRVPHLARFNSFRPSAPWVLKGNKKKVIKKMHSETWNDRYHISESFKCPIYVLQQWYYFLFVYYNKVLGILPSGKFPPPGKLPPPPPQLCKRKYCQLWARWLSNFLFAQYDFMHAYSKRNKSR